MMQLVMSLRRLSFVDVCDGALGASLEPLGATLESPAALGALVESPN